MNLHRSVTALAGATMVALAATSFGACGVGDRPALANSFSDVATVTADAASSEQPSSQDLADRAAVRAVSLVENLVVYDQPDGELVAELAATTVFGTPRVLGVVDLDADWVHVLVPVRPNDLTGWVRAADVELEGLDYVVHIDVDARRLSLFEDGEFVDEWAIAVGTPDRPTPRGHFFITDKLDTGDIDSVWGRYAFGLSAYSDVLFDFIGGDGQVGLHGTNNPSSIGNAASSGCIRLPNDVMDWMIDLLPLGTPVIIE